MCFMYRWYVLLFSFVATNSFAQKNNNYQSLIEEIRTTIDTNYWKVTKKGNQIKIQFRKKVKTIFYYYKQPIFFGDEKSDGGYFPLDTTKEVYILTIDIKGRRYTKRKYKKEEQARLDSFRQINPKSLMSERELLKWKGHKVLLEDSLDYKKVIWGYYEFKDELFREQACILVHTIEQIFDTPDGFREWWLLLRCHLDDYSGRPIFEEGDE